MEKVLSAGVDNLPVSPDAKLDTYNGATGERIAVLPIPNMMRLRRREFCRVMGEGLDIRVSQGALSATARPWKSSSQADHEPRTSTANVWPPLAPTKMWAP
jgi:hypothetical protein